jgi:signal transduction histidine kinase
MKFNKTSFLFFFIVFIGLIGPIDNSFGQKNQDSTGYYAQLAQHPVTADDLAKAYQFMKQRKERALIENESSKAILCIYHMACIELLVGSYFESETTAIEGLKLLDNLKSNNYNRQLRLAIYNHLGILYREQNNDVMAFELYDKAFQFARTASDSAILYNNKSNIYKDQRNYTWAKTELLKAMAVVPRIKDTLAKARVIANLGFMDSKLNEEDALPLMLDALHLRQLKNDTKSIYNSYSHLSEHYKDRFDIALAKTYALKAHDLALSLKSASYIQDALDKLISINPDPYVHAFKKINDSILKADKQSQNKFALMRYNDADKEKLVIKNRLESEKQKRFKLIYLFIAVFVVLLAAFVFILLKSKHKKEKLQEVLNTESRISKKVHDEVANDVYHIMTKLQHQEQKTEMVLDDLESVYNKTRDISRELSEIGVHADFKELLIDLISHYKNNNTNVIAKGLSEIEWTKVKDYKKTVIYRVIQELLTNMKKHSEATLVVLNFSNDGNKIVIEYTDNGIGCDLKKQNGLHNTENRMHAINGSITFKSEINEGFNAIMRV